MYITGETVSADFIIDADINSADNNGSIPEIAEVDISFCVPNMI